MNVRDYLRSRPACVLCGSTERIQFHHVGNRQHIAWFLMPLCSSCHEIFHVKLLQATGTDFLKSTPCSKTRLIRAMQAALVFLWTLLEVLKQEIQLEGESHD